MRQIILLSLCALTLAACSSTPVEEVSAPVTDASNNGAFEPITKPSVPSPIAEVQTAPTPTMAPESTMAPAAASLSLAGLKDPSSILSHRKVNFDYDSSTIRPEFNDMLAAHAQLLIGNPTQKILIQGHADERGSREYNLALGQQRSDAIRQALAALGVPEGQMEAVSLGEEKPTCTEQSENCWSENRYGNILYAGEY